MGIIIPSFTKYGFIFVQKTTWNLSRIICPSLYRILSESFVDNDIQIFYSVDRKMVGQLYLSKPQSYFVASLEYLNWRQFCVPRNLLCRASFKISKKKHEHLRHVQNDQFSSGLNRVWTNNIFLFSDFYSVCYIFTKNASIRLSINLINK